MYNVDNNQRQAYNQVIPEGVNSVIPDLLERLRVAQANNDLKAMDQIHQAILSIKGIIPNQSPQQVMVPTDARQSQANIGSNQIDPRILQLRQLMQAGDHGQANQMLAQLRQLPANQGYQSPIPNAPNALDNSALLERLQQLQQFQQQRASEIAKLPKEIQARMINEYDKPLQELSSRLMAMQQGNPNDPLQGAALANMANPNVAQLPIETLPLANLANPKVTGQLQADTMANGPGAVDISGAALNNLTNDQQNQLAISQQRQLENQNDLAMNNIELMSTRATPMDYQMSLGRFNPPKDQAAQQDLSQEQTQYRGTGNPLLDRNLAKEDAKAIAAGQDEVKSFAGDIKQLDKAIELTNQIGTGKLGPIEYGVSTIQEALGGKPKLDPAKVQELNYINGTFVMDKLKDLKGATSDKDFEKMDKLTGQLGNTVEGNRRIYNTMKSALQRKLEKQAFSEEWKRIHGSSLGEAGQWAKYVEQNDLLDENSQLIPQKQNSWANYLDPNYSKPQEDNKAQSGYIDESGDIVTMAEIEKVAKAKGVSPQELIKTEGLKVK